MSTSKQPSEKQTGGNVPFFKNPATGENEPLEGSGGAASMKRGDITDRTVRAVGIAADSVGVKLTYTPPVGSSAIVTFVSWFNFAGGKPTVELEHVRSAVVAKIRQDTFSNFPDLNIAPGIAIEDGDSLRFTITSAAMAGRTADALFSVIEKKG